MSRVKISSASLNKDADIVLKDVNSEGCKYRPIITDNAVMSLYNQLVNMKFHNGLEKYPFFYEYGYKAGGILTYGFCDFLERLSFEKEIEEIIFVSRDGYILKEIYDKFFSSKKSEYLIFSRFASLELIFDRNPNEYFRSNIHNRIYRNHSDNSVRNILRECHLEKLEEKICSNSKFKSETILELDNIVDFKRVFFNYVEDIAREFKETKTAFRKYVTEIIGTNKNICIVDLGWHGSSIIYLRELLEREYKLDVNIIGAMVGAAGDELTQQYIMKGIIYPYAFSNEYCRSSVTERFGLMSYDEIICIEALFSSESDSLLRYTFDENGNISFIYSNPNKNIEIIRQIHNGIRDFASDFSIYAKELALRIDRMDAYAPLDFLMGNDKYKRAILSQYYENDRAINGF